MGHGGEAGTYLACAEHVLIKLARQWRPWREQRDGSLVEHGAAKGPMRHSARRCRSRVCARGTHCGRTL
jgi:hypothetical protein